MPALTLGELRARPAEGTSRVAARVAAARGVQTHRGGLNAAMGPGDVRRCRLDNPGRKLLDAAFERLGLSAAALHRVGAERLSAAHVAEAIQCRPETEGARW